MWTDFMASGVPQPDYGDSDTLERKIQVVAQRRAALPLYAFSTQRVDLVMA